MACLVARLPAACQPLVDNRGDEGVGRLGALEEDPGKHRARVRASRRPSTRPTAPVGP